MAMPYSEGGLGTSTELAELMIKSDLIDRIKVFVYTNLSTIIAPNPLLILPPGTKSVLEAYINYLPGGFLTKDIQEILNVFILTNINSISIHTTPAVSQIPVRK